MAAGGPAAAQSTLNGDWAGIFHEDQPERIPGPELADYAGHPDQCGRPAVCRQLGRVEAHAARAPVPRARLALHLPGADPGSDHRGHRSGHADRRSPSGTSSAPTRRSARSGSTAVRIRRRKPRTRGWDSPPASGRAPSLKVYTTHLKQGWHRRNGVPMSAKATMTEYFFRHGNVLTQMSITEDPVFLTEPLVKTTNLQLNPNADANQYQAWLFCQADDEVPGRDPAYVPHFLPGKNPYLKEFADEVPAAGRTDARRCRDRLSRVREEDDGAGGAEPMSAARRCRGLNSRRQSAVGSRFWRSRPPCCRARCLARVPATARPLPRRHRRRATPVLYTMNVQGSVHVIVGAGAQRRRAGRRPRADRRGHRHGRARRGRCSRRSRTLPRGRSATSSTPTRTRTTWAATRRVGAAGLPTSGRGVAQVGAGLGARAEIIAHEQTLNRLSAPAGAQAPTPVVGLADANLLGHAQGLLLQRRGRAGDPPGGRAHRRRQRGVLPALRRDRRGRRLLHRQLPDDRPDSAAAASPACSTG